MMKLKWYGHACFQIKGENGVTIVTDPYTPETAGYDPVPDPADVVVISSGNDSFHCRGDLIAGNPTIINALDLAQNGGVRQEKGITFRAVQSMEALDHRYHDPDANGMYRFEVDGIHVGHMGDVGNPLSDEQMDFFAGLDVLLALAGDHPTIALPDLKAVIDRVQPRLVVPMHFRTLRWKPRNTLWIESFLSLFEDGDVDFAFDTKVTLTKEALPPSTRVLVLAHEC
jgi:L-ascorbate metabolism protein UlaG (beta-lactamase superfamily)